MNNNRNTNNRRGRGRNNNRNQGGGNQGNRIDSRARGNAPQLLDKYKKLAQDAHHNGDRVQMEYYLQFADHYFRVIADNNTRRDEQRGKRPDERGPSDDEDDGQEDGDFRRIDNRRTEGRTDSRSDNRNDNRNESRNDGRRSHGRRDEQDFEPRRGREGEEADDDDNPFVRRDDDEDSGEGERSRQNAPKPRKPRAARPRKVEEGDDGGFDPTVLPPSFSNDVEDEAPKPKRKLPPRRRASGGDSEPVEAVG
ncbi:DUF4167 domain-containing protein [Parerythrobacter lacustris]|uniref:DUF4167 domain-containing protein n=1 Tax=Parerythrobacter lacustris TaxID=2969984 RepID=A0ABT1XRH7_9SPHN|nr:DUF4167 domain-containing protein [Parerythrobacter lacustris]MCR2834207.1 DUF4167 domain-containing protein [Parerythrobacter lacustris]